MSTGAVLVVLAAGVVPPAGAQTPVSGASLFAETCAACHGADARGANGPDLTTLFSRGATDEALFRTIRQGVPGSVMPPSDASDAEVRALIAHLRTLAPPAAGARSGAAPAPVPIATLVMRDGRHVTGEIRNEDAFSIQMLEYGGRLQGYLKTDIREIARSVRPANGGESNGTFAGQGLAYRDILSGLSDPTVWPTFSGDYTGRRHSPLAQITPANVHRLASQWAFQTGTMTRGRGFETTPLVHDGVLYATGSNNFAWALDARTGRPFWQYRRELPPDLTYGASAPVNRGFGMLGDRLFMVTLDAHLLAFERVTGRILWDVVLADYKIGYAATLAPLVLDGKVIVGISGGEYPTRGFIDAYHPETGERLWRLNTIPDPGEPGSDTWPSADVMARGGGATWMTGTYDPDLDTLYWATGNPNPDYWGADRLGDNLYTNSLLAIDPDTGTMKWHYQFTPHDIHDWDSNHVPVLADVTIGGVARKVVMVANRNGFFYVLDRTNGQVILGTPFTDTTWARELDADGRPLVVNNGEKGCLPDMWGGTNFNPPTFDPRLNLFFLNARETCATYMPQAPVIEPGRSSFGGTVRIDREQGYGALRAIDVLTGQRRWEFRYTTPTMAGVMSTASGLVFAGDHEGNFMAFEGATGRLLWRYQTGTPIWGAAAMTHELDGRQHVVIAAGTTLLSFALPPD